jgi:hypothetical protein
MTRVVIVASLMLLLLHVVARGNASESARVIVVVGAAGSEEFEQPFRNWAERWQQAAERGKAALTVIGLESPDKTTDLERLRQALASASASPSTPLWLILLGHGTYDGKTARFSLQGPDVSSAELKELLKPVQSQLAVACCFSCSGPFLAELSGPQRVILTATKSGHEYNYSRFGDFLSASISDLSADLDKDEQTSLLEAYLAANSKLKQHYDSDARLVTEHALLDDNGDKLGTPADWFQGLRVVKQTKSGGTVDGDLAKQFVLVPSARDEKLSAEALQQRAELEQELALLRNRKAELSEADYFGKLEVILVKIAQLTIDPANSQPQRKGQ